ncbi:MAG TPA: hypothetical protein VNH11_00535 [Pirellulales bacterium]|nr:hypothetical protein [Pirellulales bacterium]
MTALIGASVALAGWKDAARDQKAIAPLPASIVCAAMALVMSIVYLLPISWVALTVRSRVRTLVLLACLTAAFAVPLLFTAPRQNWEIAVGGASGLLLTVPGSFCLWRCGGYRLLRPVPTDANVPTTEAGRELSPLENRP